MKILLPSDLEPKTLRRSLCRHALDFYRLREIEPRNYAKKYRNNVYLFEWPEDSYRFAPLSWLLAAINGASWSENNSREWITVRKQFDPVLEECGLRPIKRGDQEFELYRRAYCDGCKKVGVKPSKYDGNHFAYNRVFWIPSARETFYLPDEITENDASTSKEGTRTQRTVNAYERNRSARNICIQEHGAICAVCDFDFERQYGDIGRGFIHVHHKIPLSEIGEEYELDAKRDLVPLCPNCHAMVHKLDDPSDIADLKERMTKGLG